MDTDELEITCDSLMSMLKQAREAWNGDGRNPGIRYYVMATRHLPPNAHLFRMIDDVLGGQDPFEDGRQAYNNAIGNDLVALVQAAQACRDMLVGYAEDDDVARLQGQGIWVRPHERIADVVKQVDQAIAALVEEQPQ